MKLAGIIARSTPGLDAIWDDPPVLRAYIWDCVRSVAKAEGVEPDGELSIRHTKSAWGPVDEAYIWELKLAPSSLEFSPSSDLWEMEIGPS